MNSGNNLNNSSNIGTGQSTTIRVASLNQFPQQQQHQYVHVQQQNSNSQPQSMNVIQTVSQNPYSNQVF